MFPETFQNERRLPTPRYGHGVEDAPQPARGIATQRKTVLCDLGTTERAADALALGHAAKWLAERVRYHVDAIVVASAPVKRWSVA